VNRTREILLLLLLLLCTGYREFIRLRGIIRRRDRSQLLLLRVSDYYLSTCQLKTPPGRPQPTIFYFRKYSFRFFSVQVYSSTHIEFGLSRRKRLYDDGIAFNKRLFLNFPISQTHSYGKSSYGVNLTAEYFRTSRYAAADVTRNRYRSCLISTKCYVDRYCLRSRETDKATCIVL